MATEVRAQYKIVVEVLKHGTTPHRMSTPPQAEPGTQTRLPLDRILAPLRSLWGFDALRPLQEEAIRAVLEGRDSVVVFPTGGGKSLCYQVPPLLAERTDIVVSPLISLMKDQVDGLRLRGYSAVAVHSGLSRQEKERNACELRGGRCRLIFVSPERLLASDFLSFVESLNVRAFAIDESHCISQWGHAFRPEYRKLALLKRRFPGASIHAYTATATPRVRDDIAAQLNLCDPEVLVGAVDRPNLIYRVEQRVDARAQVIDIVRRHKGEGVIVYCLSRRDTETMADALNAAGLNAGAYHAGLSAAERQRTQDAFAGESLSVVTATVAFGMGIDRSNVRCVIHAAMPKSIEHYQQESGRAGRDGLEAECVLLYSAADALRWRSLIVKSAGDLPDPDAYIATQSRFLDQMRAYAVGQMCRHRALTEHFGQTYGPSDCGACDICLNKTEAVDDLNSVDRAEKVDDTNVIAQKIVSCVARIERHSGFGFGVKHIVDVLAGADTEMVRRHRHKSVSTYGLLRGTPRKTLTNWVYQLLDQGVLARSDGSLPTVELTKASWELMRDRRSVQLTRVRTKPPQTTAVASQSWEGVDHGLFEHLRSVRLEIAQDHGVPAFMIFSDRTLRDLARRQPTTPDTFRAVHGVGAAKLKKFGQRFSHEIKAYLETHDVEP